VDVDVPEDELARPRGVVEPRMLRSVDLPEPDGPMIETKSPSSMSRVMPRRA
jgi:hypothetical protein